MTDGRGRMVGRDNLYGRTVELTVVMDGRTEP
jgi:hypothetical protein